MQRRGVLSQIQLLRRIGILAVLLACLLRLASVVTFDPNTPIFSQPGLLAVLFRSQTGRDPSPSTTTSTTIPSVSTAPPTAPTTIPTAPTTLPTTSKPLQKPTFSATDAKALKLTYSCAYRPDVAALLTQKLQWNLSSGEPTVLILHTHGTESYTKTADTQYQNYGGSYRTDDPKYNMISIGAALAEKLEAAGIGVIHDTTPHDKDDYLDAYDNARAATEKYLKKYPTIELVLDLHRDAAQYADGTQWATSATVDGKKSAQLMFVVGTDAGGNRHPNWKQNLSVAEKLQLQLERQCSGITRPIDLRSQRFNHDLSPAAMIVEVGAAGNTHPEAMRAIGVLADAIIALQKGSA